MTVKVDDDIKTGTKFTWDFEGSEVNKIASASHSVTVYIYDSATYEADDGVFGSTRTKGGNAAWVQNVTDDGRLTVEQVDYTLTSAPGEQYLKVPIALYAENGASFKIDKLRLYADGIEKQILKCGAFFAETKARIYFSKYAETEE